MNELTHGQKVKIFEASARRQGYCIDRHIVCGRYIDLYLQSAWEIFAGVRYD